MSGLDFQFVHLPVPVSAACAAALLRGAGRLACARSHGAALCFFYGWWNPWFTILMLVSTLIDYFCGRVINAPAASPRRRKGAVLVSILSNPGLLTFFKYPFFSPENLNTIKFPLGIDGIEAQAVLS
jgi:alginate O-acetyltransferase complex protein AlgI